MSAHAAPPLDEIAIYQNAVAAMEDLAFMDQSAELPSTPVHFWSLPQYDVSIDIVSTCVKWAVYGLQMTVNLISSALVAYHPCFGRFFWHNNYEGRANFMRRNTLPTYPLGAHQASVSGASGLNGLFNKSLADGAGAVEGLDAMLLTPDPDISTVTNSNNSNLGAMKSLHAPQLEVIPTYNGRSMTARDIFAIALSTIVLGAEEGPETSCSGIQDDALDIIPIFDTQGQSLLKYRSLVKAMRLLTNWMAAKNRFGEIDIELTRDGVVIAIGRLKMFNIGVGSS